ncbi:MAG: LytTr DNA-binding region [Gemmatimonadetes bacterium]|nr:LytTr DNA-binding region [Gemmatimonadota bacterium]
MTLRVLLADDEAIARRRLVRFLRAEPGVQIVAECNGGAEALEALDMHTVDLAILDVQMPDLDGLQVVATRGAERMPTVIFVTAYDEFAVRAFEVHALDYLLKPVTAERFHAAFSRARHHIERSVSSQRGERLAALLAQVLAEDPTLTGVETTASAAPRHADRLSIKSDGRVTFVKTSDVDWVQADGNYVRVHAGSACHLIRETLGAIEAILDPDQFSRIHRSTIVNLDRIRELQPWFAGDYVVILKDGTQLKLSRTYREHLQTRLRAVL